LKPAARRLAWISIVETISFIALLTAMFLESEGGVSVIGALHGLLFLVYAFFMWIDHESFGWTKWFALGSIITGPLGAIIVLERLRRERPQVEPTNP
jgi:integral membrane protein